MEFPVDVLVSVSHEELERSAHSYMSKLLYSDPEHGQYFTLTTGRKVRISLSNVGFVPLYGANLKHKVLALFAPEDQFTAVALFLDDQWYAVDDILRTADAAREGLIKVRSVGERVVLYVLNRIVYRTNEMSAGEVPFLCHGENDYAKIFWKSGAAVGFYSVKPTGSLCNNFVSQCYVLPVMDSIFVRKGHRGNEHGLQMLEDFVDSFKEDELGLKYPLSPAMSKVCRHYLSRYPADVDLLWEVEGVGGPYQKTRVASKLSTHSLRGGLLSWEKDASKNGQMVEDKVEMTEETSLDITEEIIVVNKRLKVAEEKHDTPISTRTRSSEHKQKKRLREEKETSASESQPEKISRMEEPETEAVAPVADVEKSGEEVAESADGEGDQVAPEVPTVEQEPEEQANGELAEEQGVELNKEEAPEGAEGSVGARDVLQNGTVGEDEEEMDVDEAAEVQDPIDDNSQMESAAEEMKEAGVEKLEGDLAPVTDEHQEGSPAAGDEGVAEDQLTEESPVAAVSEEKEEENPDPSAEEKCEVAPVNEEKLEAAPEAEVKLEAAPEAEEKLEAAPEAEEKLEAAPEAEEKLEAAPEAEEKLEAAPEAEEKLDAAPEAEEKLDAAPEAEEKLDAAPEAEEKLDAAPEAEEKLDAASEGEEKLDAASEGEEKLEAASEDEEKQDAAPEGEEKQDAAPEGEEKQDAASEDEEKQDAVSEDEEKQDAAPEGEEKLEAASEDEEKQDAAPEGEEKLEAAPESEEKQDAAPEAKEKLKATPATEEQPEEVNESELAPAEETLGDVADAPTEGQEESMETEETPLKHGEETSTEPPTEEESQPGAEKEEMDRLELEEEGNKQEQIGGEENTGAMADEECRREGEGKSSDESPESSAPDVRVLRGGRTKTVPPTTKRSSKRLTNKMNTEEEQVTVDEENIPEEEKVTTEEEVEQSSEWEGPEEEPPVIDRRVLRRKVKVSQSTPHPKSKRRSRI